ncbi:MAG: hypothetical protein HQL68_04310 [Magnetococcales bacterium]|nr:hypothetical protein [Magnetococcales bacterium]
MRVITILFAILIWSNEAAAALYCVVDFNGKRCNYQDLASCKKAAGSRGDCVLNRETMIAPKGGSPYCMVENWRTQCNYHTLASCEKQAIPRKATCISNPNLATGGFQQQDKGWNSQPATKNPNDQSQQWGRNPWNDSPKKDRYLPSPGYNPRPGSR